MMKRKLNVELRLQTIINGNIIDYQEIDSLGVKQK